MQANTQFNLFSKYQTIRLQCLADLIEYYMVAANSTKVVNWTTVVVNSNTVVVNSTTMVVNSTTVVVTSTTMAANSITIIVNSTTMHGSQLDYDGISQVANHCSRIIHCSRVVYTVCPRKKATL